MFVNRASLMFAATSVTVHHVAWGRHSGL